MVVPIQTGLNKWCGSCEFGVEYPAYGYTLPTSGFDCKYCRDAIIEDLIENGGCKLCDRLRPKEGK